jgi:organic hydroperoxide reductase OsmC/OhrA
MKPFPHQYAVELSGGPGGYARVSSTGLPELQVAAPTAFDGPGDAWSPEHLLLASVETCLLLNFRAFARLSQLPFIALDVETSGTVARQDGVTRFTEIVLRPRLTVPPGVNRERAEHVLARSEKACLVSASLATPVRMEPTIVEAEAPVAEMAVG